MLNLYNGTVMTSNRKLQVLLETKLSTDDKVPKTGRVLRNKIFVIGFPPNCTEIDLENFFANFGSVREARIVKDDNGITKGYAFITFAKERSVVHALEYRDPLYFMDRKLSINPAVKKQHQLIQAERCLSSSTSIDTPSDISSLSNHTNDLNLLTNRTISSSADEIALHHYYHTASHPFVHFGIPSPPVFCASGPSPVWHHYYSTMMNYPSCPYLPMADNSNGLAMVYHNTMLRYPYIDQHNKIFQ